MSRKRKTIIGLFVAPAIPPIFIYLYDFLHYQNMGKDFADRWTDFALLSLTFLMMYVVSFFVMIFLGVPAICLGQKFKLIRWWTAMVAGAVIGAITTPLFKGLGLFSVAPCTLGALAGLTFWLFWRFNRDEISDGKSELRKSDVN